MHFFNNVAFYFVKKKNLTITMARRVTLIIIMLYCLPILLNFTVFHHVWEHESSNLLKYIQKWSRIRVLVVINTYMHRIFKKNQWLFHARYLPSMGDLLFSILPWYERFISCTPSGQNASSRVDTSYLKLCGKPKSMRATRR